MATAPEQIDEWLLIPSENHQIEFKEAKTGYSNEKLFEYCVAIANELGGCLVLGVTNTRPRKVVGTNAFPNPVKAAQQIRAKLHFRVDIDTVDHPNGRVLVFHIPSRPFGTPYNLEGKYLMRCGEELVPMTPEQLRKIFEEGRSDWLDVHSLVGQTAEQVVELLDVNAFFKLCRNPMPTDNTGIIERLKQERLIDEIGGGYCIRRIAGILMAKQLKAFPDIERKGSRVVVYEGTSKIREKLHKDGVRGYALGFGSLIRFISEQLPQNEVIEGAFRQQFKLVPDDVIRELVANALVHQDFTVSGTSVMVEIYADRVVISNPGSPIVPTERFADEHRSRNERLATVMRKIGVCEEKGSGIDRVLQKVEALQLPAPFFRADDFTTKVTIYGPKTFDELDSDERIRACYWHCALKWVMNDYLTNQSLRNRFKLSESRSSSISQVIAATIKIGWIKRDTTVGGSLRLARYVPIWA